MNLYAGLPAIIGRIAAIPKQQRALAPALSKQFLGSGQVSSTGQDISILRGYGGLLGFLLLLLFVGLILLFFVFAIGFIFILFVFLRQRQLQQYSGVESSRFLHSVVSFENLFVHIYR